MPVWRQYRPPRRESPLHLAVLLYFTGENTILRTALPYITYGVCRDLRHNTTEDMCLHLNDYPDQALDIQDDSALMSMAERMSSTLPAVLLTALCCGAWSGRYGHKAPFLLPYLGNVLSALCFLLAFYVHNVPVLAFLGAGFLTKALSGQKVLLRFLSYTYMAALLQNTGSYEEIGTERERQLECQTLLENRQREVRTRKKSETVSEEEVRRRGLLLVGVCRLQVAESLGAVVGSMLSWLCQTYGGAVWAFLVGAGVSLIGLVVVACGIKNYRLSNDNSTYSTTYVRKTQKPQKLDANPVAFWGYLSILFFASFYSAGRTALIVPYVQQAPLSWPRNRYSAYAACFTAFHTIFLLSIAPRIRNHTVVVVSLVFATAGGIWTAFSTTTWSLLAAGCFSRMVDCIFPVLRLVTLGTDLERNQIGRVLFKMSLVESFATILGPLAFAQTYIHTEDFYPGLAFLLTAAVLAVVVLVGAVVWILCGFGFKSSSTTKEEEPSAPEVAARDASQRPDYTQSVDMLRPVLVFHDCMWRSAEW